MNQNKKIMNQIQIRIDLETKNQAKKILEELGLDISAAVKMMLKQIIHTGTLPYEIRDVNGFSLKKSQELKQTIKESKLSPKTFQSSEKLIKDIFYA